MPPSRLESSGECQLLVIPERHGVSTKVVEYTVGALLAVERVEPRRHLLKPCMATGRVPGREFLCDPLEIHNHDHWTPHSFTILPRVQSIGPRKQAPIKVGNSISGSVGPGAVEFPSSASWPGASRHQCVLTKRRCRGGATGLRGPLTAENLPSGRGAVFGGYNKIPQGGALSVWARAMNGLSEWQRKP